MSHHPNGPSSKPHLWTCLYHCEEAGPNHAGQHGRSKIPILDQTKQQDAARVSLFNNCSLILRPWIRKLGNSKEQFTEAWRPMTTRLCSDSVPPFQVRPLRSVPGRGCSSPRGPVHSTHGPSLQVTEEEAKQKTQTRNAARAASILHVIRNEPQLLLEGKQSKMLPRKQKVLKKDESFESCCGRNGFYLQKRNLRSCATAAMHQKQLIRARSLAF